MGNSFNMTKKVNWIGVCVLIGLLIFSTYYYFSTNRQSTIQSNLAEKAMFTKGNWQIGFTKQRLKPGFYDITSDQKMVVQDMYVDPKNPVLNEEMYNNNSLEIRGEGKVTFKPAKFEKIAFQKEKIQKIKNTTLLIVTKDIDEGEYRLWNNYSEQIIYSSLGFESEEIRNHTIPVGREKGVTLNLRKGEIIYIRMKNPVKNDLYIEQKK